MITYRIYKPSFALKDVKVEHAETTGVQPKIITRQAMTRQCPLR